MKEMNEIRILRFFKQFSKIQIKGKRYRADKIGKSAEP